MKLSNKILLGFFGVIFLYMNAAFMEIRLTGTPNIINDENSIAEKVDLPAITYLVLNEMTWNVNVTGSDQTLLEVRSIKGDLLQKIKYSISGDTLTLSGTDTGEIQNGKITVFVPSTRFKALQVNDASADLRDLQAPLLNVYQQKGRVSMSGCSIASIRLALKDAHLDIVKTNVDTVTVALEKSRVSIYTPMMRLQGKLHNESFLDQLKDVREIQLDKDESSRLSIHNYY